MDFAAHVQGGVIEPHWMADGNRFWYAEGGPEQTVIWKVDPVADTKRPLFDVDRLRGALATALGRDPPRRGVPFDHFVFRNGETEVEFEIDGRPLLLRIEDYAISPRRGAAPTPITGLVSPDGAWAATIRDHDLWITSAANGETVEVTTDGVEDHGYALADARWSPDGRRLAIAKIDHRGRRNVPIIRWLDSVPTVRWFAGPDIGTGCRFPTIELHIADVESGRMVRIQGGDAPEHYNRFLGWTPDGSRLFVRRLNRPMNRLDVLVVDPATGRSRTILKETSETFIGGIENVWPLLFTLLPDGEAFLWLSERDGWRHLYLYDLEGNLLRRLTEGAFPVERVVAVDGEAGWVYFTARGDRSRPYDVHLYRVGLDGRGFRRLTNAPGQREVRFAPSKAYFLDAHSSLDRAPAVDLRRADGTLVRTLTRANIDRLEAKLDWRPPEPFVVAAADGVTDLHGVIYKPHDFDPSRKYPVIELIYGGPHVIFSQRAFIGGYWAGTDYYGVHAQALAQLGFVIFTVDGRGTPGRGKRFQDVAYRGIGRHEVPEHLAVLRRLAAERPYLDMSRVGIFGFSFGGYLTVRALLQAPDVYHVGVSIAGAQEIEGCGWDAYMGAQDENPEGYASASNIPLAGNLRGKLLVIVGTADPSTPFHQVMRMIDALVQAGKPHDLVVLPDQGHWFDGASRVYALEAVRRYFVEHLRP